MGSFFKFIDDYCLIHKPFEQEEKRGFSNAVPADAVRECVDFFAKSGGNLEDLVSMSNEKLCFYRDETDTFFSTNKGALKRGFSCSHEFYFLLNMLMKRSLNDADFCFLGDDGASLSEHHPIWEAGPSRIWSLNGMLIPPRGVDQEGRPVKEASVRTANIGFKHLEEIATGGQSICTDHVSRFFEIVNAFMAPEYHVGREFLSNPDNWISYRLSQLMCEAMLIVSGKPDFLTTVGRRNISEGILILSKFLDVKTGYEKMAYFGNKYVRAIRYEAVDVSQSHAVIRVHFDQNYKSQVGPYWRRCFKNSCELSKSTMGAISEKVYGLKSNEVVETASVLHPVGRDALSSVPRTLRKEVFSEIEERLSRGKEAEYSEFIYSWRRDLTGWRRVLKPLPVLVGMSSLPLVYHALSSEGTLTQKLFQTTISFSPIIIGWLMSKHYSISGRNEESDKLIAKQQATIENLEMKSQKMEIELRTKLADRILSNAARLLLAKMPDEAAEEFSNYLEHTVDPRGLTGYGIAYFATREKYLQEMFGANIKIVAPGEQLASLEGLIQKMYFKRYNSPEDAQRVKQLSDYLASECRVADIITAFNHGADGYVVVDELHEKGRPGIRAPNLLEVYETGKLGVGDIDAALDLAASIYVSLWNLKKAHPELIMPSRDSLEGTISKCVGTKDSEAPFSRGLHTYIGDAKAISDFEGVFRRHSQFIFERLAGLPKMVSFDFSPRNMVRVAPSEIYQVDLDLIDNASMPCFFARFTEMGDFIREGNVVMDDDIVIGKRKYCSKGDKVTVKDSLFYRFLKKLYASADDELRAKVDEEAVQWMDCAPVARFLKAFRHFGSCSHWTVKYAREGNAIESGRFKHLGFSSLLNAVSSLDDIHDEYCVGENRQESLSSLKESFRGIVNHIRMFGNSDLHVHGGTSHCVAKRYSESEYVNASFDKRLEIIEKRLSEKFGALAGLREHIGIVEHAQFIRYGVPFRSYRDVFDRVLQGYKHHFTSVSFGLELSLSFDGNGRIGISYGDMDEKASPGRFCFDSLHENRQVSTALSSPDEIISSSDMILAGLHAHSDGSNGSSLIRTGSDYARALEGVASVLAGLKREYGSGKVYMITHPWRYVADTNLLNAAKGSNAMLHYPHLSAFDGFMDIVYRNDIAIELNAQSILSVLQGGRDAAGETSFPLINYAIDYYLRKNRESGQDKRLSLLRVSDAHHHGDCRLLEMDLIRKYVPLISNPVVMVNG
jgi:hypothetical protein